jgi:DNA-3-methyladenine glycosylase II
MTTFTIVPDGPFSLAAAAGFGFGPNTGRPVYKDAGMKLAFVTDDLAHQVEVSLSQDPSGSVTGRIDSKDVDEDVEDVDTAAIERQVARILSLDHSGSDWLAVGEKDPVLGEMQRTHAGLRPVLFHSPYEAAAWSIISARRHRAQGAVVRNRLAATFGRVFGEGPEQVLAFPTPEQLLTVRELQGLEETRIQRLHAVANAALAGDLEPARLLAMDPGDALAHLQKLPGIGPTYSMLILLRSTGATDLVTGFEPRMSTYLAHFYGLGAEASAEQIARIMDGWRPYRTWSSVLTRVAGDGLGLPLPAAPSFANRSRR